MNFEAPFLIDHRQIKAWLVSMGVKGTINKDGFVDVDGAVFLGMKLGSLTKLPVRFGTVVGNFNCITNQLVSLEGSPKEVGGNFYCSQNQLLSLDGAPRSIHGDFICNDNQLVNLSGAPAKVVGGFICNHNQLVSLVGAPKVVDGDFNCSYNQLVNLEGAPKEVGGQFGCHHNQLVSFEGAPKKVGSHLWCYDNLLVDFKGLESTSIKGSLVVIDQWPKQNRAEQDNVIKSLNGLPKNLYSKVAGLDVQVILELEKKRAARLLADEAEELNSEVALG